MKNFKKIVLPLFFVFGIAIAATGTQKATEATPKSTQIDKEKITHLFNCRVGNSCKNSAHLRNGKHVPTLQ